MRFSAHFRPAKSDPKVGKILGCLAYSPCYLEPHHPDLFWYGVHGVEGLYTLMGTGCKTVSRSHAEDADVVTGIWDDGRIGTFRGMRTGKLGYGAMVFGAKGITCTSETPQKGGAGYKPLVVEIAKFFRTGEPPVRAEETIEMFAFMEAADESKRQNYHPVTIESVMRKAEEFNKTRKLP
jgi:hypothetical protein